MKDFLGFRFQNIHSEDLHLTVISSGSRYDKNLLPNPTDYTVDIPGANGKYYFGQTYPTREFTINTAFDNLSEQDLRRISQIFSTDKPSDLVFDENPYKTYRAKLKSKPELKYICFEDRNTKKRVYKGEATFSFICYHPFAYCFNKYVVRAADFYKCTMPQDIIDKKSVRTNLYNQPVRPRQLTGLIKDHYNVKNNMMTPWKGGYPTIEQVQWGELYFNEEHENNYNGDCQNEVSDPPVNKMIINVRGYWDNVPKWQETAKLLTTPTLDFEQELIYMPQYSNINYYNMDTGLNKQNNLMGSRLLVYNPGDVPIDFKLKLGSLSSKFRGNLDKYTFRVSRYNVQRLTIEQAVDWVGLETMNEEDNTEYKYGTHYFFIGEKGETLKPSYRELKHSHPTHCYITEPIPQEHLSDFIRLFYYQSNLLFQKIDNTKDITHILNHEEGEFIAERYDELRKLCINDDERNQLYWETLFMLFDKYREFDENYLNPHVFSNEYTIDDFIHDIIFNPPEYIRKAHDLNYREFLFNITHIPQYYTYDYLDINSKDFDKIPYCDCGCDVEPKENKNRPITKPLILDSEKEMLYNIQQRDWKNCPEFFKNYPEKEKNLFNFKPQKLVFNENVQQGHWFKIPPGWSLISVDPVVDEDIWGGKRWLDARPFDWGTTNENFRTQFNEIYHAAAQDYLSVNCPSRVRIKYMDEEGTPEEEEAHTRQLLAATSDKEELYDLFGQLSIESMEDYLQFRRWLEYASGADVYNALNNAPYDYRLTVENYKDKMNLTCKQIANKLLQNLGFEIFQFRKELYEIKFLKLLDLYWRLNTGGDLDDWWWYANDYTWANFPPLYWGYADLLNRAEIEYIPQFY